MSTFSEFPQKLPTPSQVGQLADDVFGSSEAALRH